VTAEPATKTEPSKADTATAPAEKKQKVFTGTAGQLQTRMEELFQASRLVNSPTASEKSEARAKIDKAVDWEQIAQTCLGSSNWKKQSASNRNAFRGLLKDVVERTAFSRMDKFWKNATSTIDKIDVTGNAAHILAHFQSTGEKSKMKLEYYFHKKGGEWLMDDVAYNGLRYSININEQLDSFLREKSFAELLKSLRKRRDELVTDAKSDAR